MRAGGAQAAEELCRLVVKGDGRPAARHSLYFYVLPGDAAIPTGANGFHGGFFGDEASGIPLCFVGLGLAVADFGGREDPLKEAPPKALDGVRDARDFCDIDTGTDDHRTAAFRFSLSAFRYSLFALRLTTSITPHERSVVSGNAPRTRVPAKAEQPRAKSDSCPLAKSEERRW